MLASRIFRGFLETSLPALWFFEISSLWLSEIAAEQTTDLIFLAIGLTHGFRQIWPARQREIQDHYSKRTLQRTSRSKISGVTLFYFMNKSFTSEKCLSPKYFTWRAIHMCVENSARSYSSSSYPFKECKAKKLLKTTFVTSVIALVFVCSRVSDQRWTTEHCPFSVSSHQLQLCFGCCCCGFALGRKQAIKTILV